jgi:bifunctional DNA-binding transcriptional regulator/antitoxin component of YhaV-PrlF toxin-antitoxin module
MTGKNQVTVPAEIAARVGLGPGTRLEWRVTDRKDVLEVRVLPDLPTLARQLRGRGARSGGRKGSAVERLVEERERDEETRP